jgi:hypothetical protein
LDDIMSDIPYQLTGLVKQLEAERANAAAIGLTSRVDACDKQLRELGVKAKAAEKRAAALSVEDAPKSVTPRGRSAKPHETA